MAVQHDSGPVDIKLQDPISKPLCMIDISSQETNSNNLWSHRRDGEQHDALVCTQSLNCKQQLNTDTLICKKRHRFTNVVLQQTTDNRENTSGSPHCQSFGPVVWIHKEAPGNGFLMGSGQDRWADRKYVKYLLFWLRLELWPYLKIRA